MRIKKIRWEIAHSLRHGVCIKPTMRCNLRCPYCAIHKKRGRMPFFQELSADEWKYILTGEMMVTISGGEPSLYKPLPELVNWMIDRGMLVLIFTNLSRTEPFLRIKKSWRVVIYSTYHEVMPLDRFLSNHEILKNRFYISVRELRPPGETLPKHIPWAKVHELRDEQDDHFVEIYSPDGRQFHNCAQVDEAGE